VIGLIMLLTFKVGSAALKGARAAARGVARGAQAAARGAVGAARRAGQFLIKGGKVLLRGAGDAIQRGVKSLRGLGERLLARTRFRGFRIRVAGGRWVLEGRINPWIVLATGTIQVLARSASEIDDLVDQLRASGRLQVGRIAGSQNTTVDDILDGIARRAKLGEHGAQGELAALERRVLRDGQDVDLLREVQRGEDARFTRGGTQSEGAASGERTTPDLRTRTGDPELVDVKTAVEPPTRWDNWIRDQINSVNRQVRNSRLISGNPGGADLQLFGNAATDFQRLSPADVNRAVRGNFNPNRGSSLQRVTIYTDGQKAYEFVRAADGTVQQVFP
jgi:hypothetical protein